MARRGLDDYGAKRDFERTREPAGAAGAGGDAGSEQPRFVIQKHAATSLHYDLRLEVDGVLASWAVPKGPSTDPREKRLAIQVEDHPIEYGGFEGVIARGNYGAGAVIIWDAGTYASLAENESMAQSLERGHVSVQLAGSKLRGGYTLQRTGGGEKPRWLLIKRRDEEADARRNPVSSQPESVLSGRTIEDVGATREP